MGGYIHIFSEKLRNSGELPSETQVTRACDKVIELLSHESTVLSIDAPVTIVGDVHGQFYDVLEIFRVNGELPHANYLFLGDYVDRGYYSLETLLYLILLKIVYPNRVFLIRGNHESVQITQVYGFYDECLRSYETPFVYNKCVAVFEMLPLSAVVNNDTFTVHGGLSPRITKVDEIREISRPCDVPLVGTVLDLLWSDPEEDITEWSASPRGAGFLFGKRPAEYFCKVNGFKSIVRAHQLVMEGYKHHFDKLCV